ncbi:hypothetical protein EDC65_1609 [Stella humosa]|uniref:Uncharacterized protein n=1 Tax=Stella humosa TaxID=94 RepID=A0A3N1M818_9PROT|nr:hypothetical protein [Stella humosa]ROP99820.1 hypothetical protein EDC65_1609 [Stella humosa]BBK30952.1 hypothetical protein STHU_15860 [Stella humosa]
MRSHSRWTAAALVLTIMPATPALAEDRLQFTFTNRMPASLAGKGVVDEIAGSAVVASGQSGDLYGPFPTEGSGGHIIKTRDVHFQHRTALSPVYCSWRVSITVNLRCDGVVTCSQYWSCAIVSQRAEQAGIGCDGKAQVQGVGCRFTFEID